MQISRGVPGGKILNSGPLRIHFQNAGAKLRVFEQNTEISLFFFYSVTEDMNTLVFLKIYFFLPIAINHWLF